MNTCAQCLVMNTCEQCLLLSLHSFSHVVDASSLCGLAASEVSGVAQIEQLLFCWAYEALRLPELCPSPLELRKRCGLARGSKCRHLGKTAMLPLENGLSLTAAAR